MGADDDVAALEAVVGAARGVEEGRHLERLEFLHPRLEIVEAPARKYVDACDERSPHGIGRGRHRHGAGVVRFPQVPPRGGRRLDLLDVVHQAEGVEARAQCVDVPARLLVDRLRDHPFDVRHFLRVDCGDEILGAGELGNSAVHPGDVDCRVALLLAQLGDRHGGDAGLGRRLDPGRLDERIDDAFLDSLPPGAAVEGDG